MVRNNLLYWIRKSGMMPLFDSLFFRFNKLRYATANKRFRHEHPGFILPPDYMLYEAYRLDANAYYRDGRETAAWVISKLNGFASMGKATILEWGCGPSRITRHLPSLLPHASIHACDYNSKTIDWCRENISGIDFKINGLQPPLPYENNFFDAVYAISVITHLSGENHCRWIKELHRIIKPGGILLITSQGAAFLKKLRASEQEEFSKGNLVERGIVKEGHRSFSAFHPESWMRSLFSGQWTILSHEPGEVHHWGPEQDTWVVQKNN
jgi:SAM-dependent methyltransferase